MATLPSDLRNKLERVVIDARDAAEAGARAALEALAVHEAKYYPHMSKNNQELRNHLRARARQLGDRQDGSGRLGISHLVGECAYEHWHRMLFARFLAENSLLIEPQDNVAISLAEAEELAKEEGVNVWVFASRCAQRMLPQIFRPDDPLLAVSFAKEHMLKLENLLDSLPSQIFMASDALGWVYQFWQTKKKKEVNDSEVKIGADELPAVTQLFTEPYMVSFLIHNTLGAWWAGKKIAENPSIAKDSENEDQLRAAVALPGVNWDYLRFIRDENSTWRPAAGTFEGWPKTASEIKILDPCCGSGHFLVAILHHLVPIRMAEENLTAQQAVDAVLQDNLHGLEIDERCCQIAAFALAFAAWTYPNTSGYRHLPEMHIACSGLAPNATLQEWLDLAASAATTGGIPTERRLFDHDRNLLSDKIQRGLEQLYDLFAQAATLGSLINPTDLASVLTAADYGTIKPYLDMAMEAETDDNEMHERAIAAAGMVKAADLLAGKYSLIITNVPYLARGKQSDLLKDFIRLHHDYARQDLATAFLDRSLSFSKNGGTLGIVCPQNWLSLPAYSTLRNRLLKTQCFEVLAKLGPGAFDTISGEVVNVALLSITNITPPVEHYYGGVDISGLRGIPQKLRGLTDTEWRIVAQKDAIDSPDARITLEARGQVATLGEYANSPQGIKTGDDGRFRRNWWEPFCFNKRWRPFQGTPEADGFFGGMRYTLDWTDDGCEFARLQGTAAWDKRGVIVKLMGDFSFSLYNGEFFDSNVTAIVPNKEDLVKAVWTFCLSPTFRKELSVLEDGIKVNNATVVKVPFDLVHWQKVADEKYPNGLPEPESNDPTQWLFHGWPEKSTAPLQVTLARLLGYRWPAELDEEMRLSSQAKELVKSCNELLKFVDEDGIVCIPSVRGEDTATDRLMALLSECGITPAKIREFTSGATLDDWLRNNFFEEHCKLFLHRPFIWHIWDGRKRDGFHALVNYHKLAEGNGKGRKLLESLTYSYLGDWITRQEDGIKRGEGGADDRLAAALELKKRLEAILAGEPPYDIFVRWKPLHQQPIGWEPDINDGVRLNIRPFMAGDILGGKKGAGILRDKPNIKWKKDRGKEPERPKEEYPWFWGWDEKTQDFMGSKEFDGNRWNDCHYIIKAKQAARDAAREGR